ncbi:MAG: hypothetical protein PUF37_01075 [Prevotellaceae bacterium]|nr:hypothetical protein [Prevotellaceae bacterium]
MRSKGKASDMVEITCYGRTRIMRRDKAEEEFLEGMIACEGSEKETYTDIYLQLMGGCMKCSDED